MSSEILDVDLIAFESGSTQQRNAVVDGVKRSLATGFVYTDHDIEEDFLDEVYAMLGAFFHLPLETKQAYAAPESHGQTGYTGLLVETAAISDVADWKEMINFGRSLPDNHPLRARYPHRYHEPVLPEADLPGSTALLLEFHDRVLDVQRRFLRVIAVGLGASEDFFDRQLSDGSTLTRAIRYPPMQDAPGDQHVWADEHADINLITALPRATARGLQVKVDDAWVDASPPPGHMIINTGMMLEDISNGVIPSGIHRVVAEPGQTDERISVVQFCHPTPWTVLSPLPTCVTPDNPQRFSPMTAGDRLDQVLYEIGLIS